MTEKGSVVVKRNLCIGNNRRFYNVLNYHKICYTFQVKTFKQNETNRNGTIYNKTAKVEKEEHEV